MENNEIKLDIIKIDTQIKKDNIYEDGDIKFQFCKDYNPENKSDQNNDIDFPKYIAKINLNSFKYLGILSKNLKKELYGCNCYENGDEYFGQWNKDKKEGYGIYYYKEKGGDEIKQIYMGEFKNNVKSGEGLYFHIFKSEHEEEITIPVDFNLAIGIFSGDTFIKGTIFSIKEGKRKIYKGKLSKEGKRNDENSELYEDNNKIFHGKFKEDDMIEGRIIMMKEGKKESGYYFTKKSEDDITFDNEKEEKDDNKFINKLNTINDIFKTKNIQDLFISIIEIRFKLNSSNSFDYMKNLNYETEVKQKLKDLYAKYFYY